MAGMEASRHDERCRISSASILEGPPSGVRSLAAACVSSSQDSDSRYEAWIEGTADAVEIHSKCPMLHCYTVRSSCFLPKVDTHAEKLLGTERSSRHFTVTPQSGIGIQECYQ